MRQNGEHLRAEPVCIKVVGKLPVSHLRIFLPASDANISPAGREASAAPGVTVDEPALTENDVLPVAAGYVLRRAGAGNAQSALSYRLLPVITSAITSSISSSISSAPETVASTARPAAIPRRSVKVWISTSNQLS